MKANTGNFPFSFGPSEKTLAFTLYRKLLEKNLRISTAESCTGGLLANALVSVPGISEVYPGGFVTYSDEAKARDLGVSKKALAFHTAVSPEVSRQMALGLKLKTHTDIALSTTGLAGPTGGSSSVPVGTVYISCACGDRVITRHFVFSGARERVRKLAVREALSLALYCLEED